MTESRHLGERVLGAGRAAEHVGPLQHHHPQAGAGQQDGRDQAVVAATDDHGVGGVRHILDWAHSVRV